MKNKMLESALSFAVLTAAFAVPSVAFADNTAPNPEGKVIVTKIVTVVGHRQQPSVVIEIARLSAAHEAGIAHDSLRKSLVEQSMPAALRQH